MSITDGRYSHNLSVWHRLGVIPRCYGIIKALIGIVNSACIEHSVEMKRSRPFQPLELAGDVMGRSAPIACCNTSLCMCVVCVMPRVSFECLLFSVHRSIHGSSSLSYVSCLDCLASPDTSLF